MATNYISINCVWLITKGCRIKIKNKKKGFTGHKISWNRFAYSLKCVRRAADKLHISFMRSFVFFGKYVNDTKSCLEKNGVRICDLTQPHTARSHLLFCHHSDFCVYFPFNTMKLVSVWVSNVYTRSIVYIKVYKGRKNHIKRTSSAFSWSRVFVCACFFMKTSARILLMCTCFFGFF